MHINATSLIPLRPRRKTVLTIHVKQTNQNLDIGYPFAKRLIGCPSPVLSCAYTQLIKLVTSMSRVSLDMQMFFIKCVCTSRCHGFGGVCRIPIKKAINEKSPPLKPLYTKSNDFTTHHYCDLAMTVGTLTLEIS